MLYGGENPFPGPTIRARLNLSKPRLTYHIKQLTDSGLVVLAFKDGCNFYELTEHGKAMGVKIPSGSLIAPHFGLHNIAFKFRILDGQPFKLKETVSLRGWDKNQGWVKNCYVFRTNGHLVIHPIPKGSRLYGSDSFLLQQRARDKAISIAAYLANKHNLRLGEPIQSREPHFAIEDMVAKSMDAQVSTPEYHIDDSETTGGEIDFRNPKTANDYIRSLTGAGDGIARLEATVTKLTEVLALQAEAQANLTRDVHYIAENYRSHVKIVEITARVLDKLDARLSQRNLRGYL
jgi:biotin operon repressor